MVFSGVMMQLVLAWKKELASKEGLTTPVMLWLTFSNS